MRTSKHGSKNFRPRRDNNKKVKDGEHPLRLLSTLGGGPPVIRHGHDVGFVLLLSRLLAMLVRESAMKSLAPPAVVLPGGCPCADGRLTGTEKNGCHSSTAVRSKTWLLWGVVVQIEFFWNFVRFFCDVEGTIL